MDIAFEGLDIYTNSDLRPAPSPRSARTSRSSSSATRSATFLSWRRQDRGAFLRWYAYDNVNHVLDSRFHVYGVKDGDKTYKVQVLSYYAKLRVRRRTRSTTCGGRKSRRRSGPLSDVKIDGRAGGPAAPATERAAAWISAPRVDVVDARRRADLERVARVLSPRKHQRQWRSRRTRGVGAVDFDADKTASETLAMVTARPREREASL